MESKRNKIFELLCKEHCDGYIRIGDEYIPVRSDIFDFDIVRKIKSNVNGSDNKHNELPIFATIENSEKDIFQKFYDYVMFETKLSFNTNEEICRFIELIRKFVDEKELMTFITATVTTNNSNFWIHVAKNKIQIPLTLKYKCQICEHIIESYAGAFFNGSYYRSIKQIVPCKPLIFHNPLIFLTLSEIIKFYGGILTDIYYRLHDQYPEFKYIIVSETTGILYKYVSSSYLGFFFPKKTQILPDNCQYEQTIITRKCEPESVKVYKNYNASPYKCGYGCKICCPHIHGN
jgi:hypothetical protein